ncbi:Sucrase/ferredoxin-like-domain-containing protein [Aspergillus cavernicola]|uniref:Altered inheritance of mitochondria protein 32 n=1 Tax=Aspergillus cavernicola TaxID=176166 RepID=A0ABR4IKK7_9EURO
MRLLATGWRSPTIQHTRTRTSGAIRGLSSSNCLSKPRRIPLDIPPPFPVTKTCSEPRCSCPPTPSMPEGLPLDHDHPLSGTMAAYAQQIVICTGQRDWTSRIEDDGKGQSWGEVVRGVKGLMGRGGLYADPFNNVMITNSSLSPSSTAVSSSGVASAFLFPSFKYFPSVPIHASDSSKTSADLSTFVQAFLLPTKLSPMTETLPEPRHSDLLRKPELAAKFDAVDLRHSPVILICGHGGRDMRCGVMAPILEEQFRKVLKSKGIVTPANTNSSDIDRPGHAHIGLISHIGGHKYAGNVIIYIPKSMKYGDDSSARHPLAGKGIWYGRIEPKHVEGVVENTILGGKVVSDHFRGGIDHDGSILRL